METLIYCTVSHTHANTHTNKKEKKKKKAIVSHFFAFSHKMMIKTEAFWFRNNHARAY